jgi:hypothetical protein
LNELFSMESTWKEVLIAKKICTFDSRPREFNAFHVNYLKSWENILRKKFQIFTKTSRILIHVIFSTFKFEMLGTFNLGMWKSRKV